MVVKIPLRFLFDLSHNLQSINFDYLLSFLSKIISNLSTTTYITIIILVLFTFFFKVLIKKSHQTKQKTATQRIECIKRNKNAKTLRNL